MLFIEHLTNMRCPRGVVSCKQNNGYLGDSIFLKNIVSLVSFNNLINTNKYFKWLVFFDSVIDQTFTE